MCGVGARLPGALWRCIINSLLQSCLVKFMIKGASSYWRCDSSLFNRSFRIIFSYLPIIYYPLPSERQIGNSSHVSDDCLFLWRNIVQQWRSCHWNRFVIHKPPWTKNHSMAIKVKWTFPLLNESLSAVDSAFPIHRYGKIIVDWSKTSKNMPSVYGLNELW